eukprot:scaffold735_cov255-Pinguiococcus_pyrenoidosus.AAC.23
MPVEPAHGGKRPARKCELRLDFGGGVDKASLSWASNAKNVEVYILREENQEEEDDTGHYLETIRCAPEPDAEEPTFAGSCAPSLEQGEALVLRFLSLKPSKNIFSLQRLQCAVASPKGQPQRGQRAAPAAARKAAAMFPGGAEAIESLRETFVSEAVLASEKALFERLSPMIGGVLANNQRMEKRILDLEEIARRQQEEIEELRRLLLSRSTADAAP